MAFTYDISQRFLHVSQLPKPLRSTLGRGRPTCFRRAGRFSSKRSIWEGNSSKLWRGRRQLSALGDANFWPPDIHQTWGWARHNLCRGRFPAEGDPTFCHAYPQVLGDGLVETFGEAPIIRHAYPPSLGVEQNTLGRDEEMFVQQNPDLFGGLFRVEVADLLTYLL